MKGENRIQQLLARYLTRYGEPSGEHIEAAVEKVWERLKPGVTNGPADFSLRLRPARVWRSPLAAFAAIAILILGAGALIHRIVWTDAVLAIGEIAEGGVRLSGRIQAAHVGDPIEVGTTLLAADSGAVLQLTEGSRVEMRAQSELNLARSDDGVRLRLNKGGIIINAAKQRAGRLFVQTKDMTVSVAGTVFVVNAEEKGSRVAVIEGAVEVQKGTTAERLLPGQQAATNPIMPPLPVTEEISWSRNAASHLALLQESIAQVQQSRIPPPAAETKRMEFEVVSLRDNPSATARTRLLCHGVDGVFSASGPSARMVAPAMAETVPLGRCVGDNVRLSDIIITAYGLPFSWRISNMSEWEPMAAFYQIQAKAENASSATGDELRQMLQSMLSDRFKLKVHRGTSESDGYALVIAKDGLRIPETTGVEGYLEPSSQASPGRSIHGKFRMQTFAELMTDYIGGGTAVVDMTGLRGLYEVELKLNRIGSAGGVRSPVVEPGQNLGVFDPPLFKAIEQQLGLRLEARKVTVETIVIGHVEKAFLQ